MFFWEKSKSNKFGSTFQPNSVEGGMAFHPDQTVHRDVYTGTAKHQTYCLSIRYLNHFDHILISFGEYGSLDIYEFNHELTAAQCWQSLRKSWDIQQRTSEVVMGLPFSLWRGTRFTSLGIVWGISLQPMRNALITLLLVLPEHFLKEANIWISYNLCKIAIAFFAHCVFRTLFFKKFHY